MKVKVIKKFKDKANKEVLRKVNDTFEVSDERFKELKGYVVEVKEVNEAKIPVKGKEEKEAVK